MAALRALDKVLGVIYDFPYFDLYFTGRPINLIAAFGYSLLRCLSGVSVASGVQECARPKKPLRLYEFEACPFCRKVREALCVLDLDVEVRPCPKPALVGKFGTADESSRFRSEVADPGGRTKFPVLVDDNEGGIIRGSEEIIVHLFQKYGKGAEPPMSYRAGRVLDGVMPLFMLPSFLRLRSSHGILKKPSRVPEKPLILWGYEASPFVKIVREALCCLELPYTYRIAAHGSEAKRREFAHSYGQLMRQGGLRRTVGAIQVPMLVDPNRDGVPIFESADIVRYLYETYGMAAVKSE